MRLSSRLAGVFVLALPLLAISGPARRPTIPSRQDNPPRRWRLQDRAPPYTASPDLKAKPGVPKGKRFNFTMDSKDSKTFPGIKGPYKRNVSVYVPSQYVPGTEAPFIVTHDAMGGGEIPTLLDNLIADKKLPVMIAIFVPSGGGDSKGSERGLEYDTVSGKYAEYHWRTSCCRWSRRRPT